MNHVIIAGGGWVGLAAAVELCHRGIPVTLFEAAKQVGGRARCVAFDGDTVDNGQHLMIGAYRETLRLLARVHAPHPIPVARHALQLQLFTTAADYALRAPLLPAPLHLVAALLGARGLTFAERQRALRFCIAMAWRGFVIESDISVAALLNAHRQTPRLIECVWEPLCLATLNTPLSDASAQVFLRVLHDAFARRRADSDVLFATTDLGQLFPAPALDYIEQHGGTVRLGARVDAVHADDGHGLSVQISGERHHAQHVILATPSYTTQKLIAPFPALAPIARNLEQLAYEPICTLYLRYPAATSLGTDMIGFTGTLTQWLVDRSHCDQPGLMAAVISARGAHMDLDNAELTRHVIAEIAQRFPAWPAPHTTQVIREKRATFSCCVNVNALRPRNLTAIPNLWLAGDYTNTGYPATLEGAVRSGVACTEAIEIK